MPKNPKTFLERINALTEWDAYFDSSLIGWFCGSAERAKREGIRIELVTEMEAVLCHYEQKLVNAATEALPEGASDASAPHATHPSGAAPLFSDRVKDSLHPPAQPDRLPELARTGSGGEATVPPLDAGLPQSSGSLPDLETMRQQLAQSLEEFGYQASGSCSATAPSTAAPASPGLPKVETRSCPDSAEGASSAQPQNDNAATA